MFERIKAAFSNDRGMLDTSSILVGVVITGIIGAITAVTFAVLIPWLQDNGAKDDIRTIKTAEDSNYSDNSKYADLASLYNANYLNRKLSPACVQLASSAGADYTIYMKSNSGTLFSYQPSQTNPVVLSAGTTIPCTFGTYGS